MSSLPREILREIFFLLQLNDKIQCTLVCRHWNETIKQIALYQTLFISENNINKIFIKIQQDPSIAAKIERVIICFMDGSFKYVNHLLFCLPALKELQYFLNNSSKRSLKNALSHPWKNSIRKIVDFAWNGPSFNILSSGEFPNLTTLKIFFNGKSTDLFKNIPSLTTLDLTDLHADFNTLETIHDSLPNLESFKIYRCRFSDSVFRQENIKPAMPMITCVYDLVNFRPNTIETRIQLLKYMRRKYPNLTAFTFRGNQITTGADMKDLNDPGWKPLLTSWKSRLNKIAVGQVSSNTDLLAMMDQADCRIKELWLTCRSHDVLANMEHSLQVSYIQILELSLGSESSVGDFGWLKRMQVLKELRLKSSGKLARIKLGDIVDNSPPILKTLSFSRVRLTAYLNATTQSNVNQLSFYALKFPEYMNNFILQYFPKLSVLKVRHCEVDDNALNLATLKLVKFQFAMCTNDSHLTVLLVCNNNLRLYTCSSLYFGKGEYMNSTIQESALIIPFKSYAQSKSTTAPHFILICNSVNQISFTP